MTEFSDRPFAAGSVFGLRSFRIADDMATLTGVSVQEPWTEGENLARCLPNVLWYPSYHPLPEPQQHRPALKDHTCGFYAYFDGSNVYKGTMGMLTVTGIIEGYGLVTVGSRGFRAEKARMRALVSPLPMSNYPSVPVFTFEEDALAEFPLTKPEDVGVDPNAPQESGYWVRGYAPSGAVVVTLTANVQPFIRHVTQAMPSCTEAIESVPPDPVERKRLAAEEAAQRRASAGLRGVGGFDRRGRRR